ncbi:EXPERA domain-containing protein [Sporobolomyces koalae]|uniref:EXPERA domain-containing protein n=1 Tax=Sporobolomyces koalae TaxID=500713 RepID=UPI0031759E5F
MASLGPPPTLLNATTVLSLLATVALLFAALLLAKTLLPTRSYRDRIEKWTFVWLAFDALTHFILEGSFLWQSFPVPRSVNTSQGPFALLWQEYARADTRWGTADSTVVSIELITVLGAGPLCVYLMKLMVSENPAWRYWIVVLSTAEIYGGMMTFFPEWITGSPALNASHWLYTYVYLLFFNGLWVVIPLYLMYDSYHHIVQAMHTSVLRNKKRE